MDLLMQQIWSTQTNTVSSLLVCLEMKLQRRDCETAKIRIAAREHKASERDAWLLGYRLRSKRSLQPEAAEAGLWLEEQSAQF